VSTETDLTTALRAGLDDFELTEEDRALVEGGTSCRYPVRE
jgi:hypothetical protein